MAFALVISVSTFLSTCEATSFSANSLNCRICSLLKKFLSAISIFSAWYILPSFSLLINSSAVRSIFTTSSANATTLSHFGVLAGTTVRVRQGDAVVLLPCAVDDRLPDRVVRVPAGHASTAGLGPLFGSIVLERA